MKIKVDIWITLVGVLIGAISNWIHSYHESNLTGTYTLSVLILGSLVGSFLLTFYLKKRYSEIALLVTLGVVLAFIARIVYDTTFLDHSHNLFPFEIITSLITLPSAFTGSFLGHLIKRFKKK